jgi:trimethylamine--corrinoid protein Co-methyltransferase
MRMGGEHRILSGQQIREVEEYAFRLLEEVGCQVRCEEAIDILASAGCDVRDRQRVKIPRKAVREAIEAAAKRIEVYDRDGRLAMTFQKDRCYYGTGSDCITTIDLYTGARRMSTKADVANLARFTDALTNMDFVMSFGIANDAPGGKNFVHQYDAMLRNTVKPIIVTGHGRGDMSTIVEMAAAAVGGVARLKQKPPLALYSEPISPLVHSEMGVGKGLICCEYGIPFIYIGSPYMGATAPATLEAILVQAVAESLSGLVIFQNKKPGAKFIFGGDATAMDMQSAIFSYGCPELNVLNAGLADMAHHYGLPFFCIAGSTDAKTVDAQAGLEYALSLFNATLNGCNIIHDCGYLEYGSTSSFESLLLADEIVGMIKFMLRPLDFKEETVPLALMNKVGPGGNFLLEDHTLQHYRSSVWFPRFLDRRVFDKWREAGSRDLAAVLNEQARRIFDAHHPTPLSQDVCRELDGIIGSHRADV